MRKIERTGQFKRDYKREAKGPHRLTLDADMLPVLKALARDQPLDPRYSDHAHLSRSPGRPKNDLASTGGGSAQ